MPRTWRLDVSQLRNFDESRLATFLALHEIQFRAFIESIAATLIIPHRLVTLHFLHNMATTSLGGLAGELSKLGITLALPAADEFQAPRYLHRPLDIWRAYLALHISEATKRDIVTSYDAIQTTSNLAAGDLTLPVPRLRFKSRTPNDLCAELASRFSDEDPLFKKPVPNGIHLPFYLKPRVLPRLLTPYIYERGSSYGKDETHGLRDPKDPASAERKRIIIEFSSPNIAKEFHAGHLRSTIIGAFLANLYKDMGWDVIKINYLGDWGKQFGLLAVGWERFGSEEEMAKQPLKHLLDVYARINVLFKPEQDASKKARKEGRDTAEIESQGLFAERNAFFRRMEDSEPSALALWKRFRNISIERYISTYGRLNIHFDEYSGESQVQSSTVRDVEKELRERNVYEEDDGSWKIDFTKYGHKSLGVAVVRGRTGTTSYLLRDVAAVLEREKKYAFDQMVYVVSSEQDLYFQRLFKTLELIGQPDLANRVRHVNFGKVMGMSSRLGNVLLLSDILDQSGATMHEVMRRNETKYAQIADPLAAAEAVGISAIMVQDMSGKRINDYAFDISKMTSFEGDTGPYLQYCHARLNSILRQSNITRPDLSDFFTKNPDALDGDLDEKHQCLDLLRLMAQYPDVTATAYQKLEPSTILTYLFRLSHQISSCYDVLQVKGAKEGNTVIMARAALFEAARQVLENGMRLLGLSPVDRYVMFISQTRVADIDHYAQNVNSTDGSRWSDFSAVLCRGARCGAQCTRCPCVVTIRKKRTGSQTFTIRDSLLKIFRPN